MTTYTKETALYDTSSIANDIEEAGNNANSYITSVGTDGLKVHPSGQSGDGIVDFTLVDADGMGVYKSGDRVAQFGESAAIGIDGSSQFVMGSDSLTAFDSSGNQYFSVSANGITYGGKAAALKEDMDAISNQVMSIVEGLQSSNYTTYTQTDGMFSFDFSSLNEALEAIESYVHISGDTMILGSSDTPVCAELSSTGLVFYPIVENNGQREADRENPIASLVVEGSGDGAEGVLVIHRAVVVNELRFGDWAWMPRGNGNLALKWIGA